MPHQNAQFLNAVTAEVKAVILDSIAKHYGISPERAYDEVTDDEAERLLDYMVEPQRGATSVLMQRHGFR